MTGSEIFTHEDDLFGRVALFNNLITLEQVVECGRVMAAEEVADRVRRSLATHLILKGYVTAAQAGAVEAALRKRAAAAAGQPVTDAEPPPKPKRMEERAPEGHSQIAITIGEETEDESDERLKKIIASIVPGRIYPEMLRYIVRNRISIINIKALARDIGESAEDVTKAIRLWKSLGLVRSASHYPYNWSPSAQQDKDIKFFLYAWEDTRRHAKILGMVLAAE